MKAVIEKEDTTSEKLKGCRLQVRVCRLLYNSVGLNIS